MRTLFLYLLNIIFIIGCSGKRGVFETLNGDSQYLPYQLDGIPVVVADTAWTADMYGNHRAVVEVPATGDARSVSVNLPWRRPDLRPETKKIVVVAAHTGEKVKNVFVKELSAEQGSLIFEPVSGSGTYYIYYLPYTFRKGWNDARYGEPWNDYLPPVYDEVADPWLSALPKQESELIKAKVLRFESRSRFDSFTPMGAIATAREADSLRNIYTENPVIFTEDRAFPIRLKDHVPLRWVEKGASDRFQGDAKRNEYFVWQLGVWAAHQSLADVKLEFTDFVNGIDKISKSEVTCFNQEGVNWDGKPISFTIDVPEHKVQALWCGIQIPEKAATGVYKGKVFLTATGIAPREIDIEINVDEEMLADKGDGDLWRHARLRWLNSTIGSDNLPVTPYQAVSIDNNEIHATDKTVTLAASGLPGAIKINNQEVLSEPFRFIVQTSKGDVTFDASNLTMKKEADGLITWTSSSEQAGINFNCAAYMEYDGYIRYHLDVSARQSIPVHDIRLVTDYSSYSSNYFMGVGFKGGYTPTTHKWHWDGPYDSYWMGNAKAGLHVEYRGGNYHGPLLNDYKPAPPAAWANQGHGSISLMSTNGVNAQVIASTGKDTLSSKSKRFEFALLITPVRPVDPAKHFDQRYYHADPSGFYKASEDGANIANIHHAQKLNPVINYPFIVRDSLVDFIERQHHEDRKVKLYYTIRELTNYTAEIFALHSLNHEVLAKGVGYGLPWHTEHLVDGYKPAWYTEMPGETSDAALVLSGFSRWINYYLEGLRWMLENYSIDGIYMDDVSFDRNVMKRMRKIMEKYRPGALIDLHSNTGYSIGPANQYTDFFPYVDRLWFGESFKYNEMMPDEWFVTFSGIPFGQMSEMLQDGGNRYLGMVYGATARHSYGEYSPVPVWDLWESFGIKDAKMLGYWDDECPVKTNHEKVKATAYIKEDKVLIAVGNFDSEDRTIQLDINWDKLGINPKTAKSWAPAVKDFQAEKGIDIADGFSVKSKEGLLLIISDEKRL